MNLEPIFLAIALCFNADCTDQQIYIADEYKPTEMAACRKEKEKREALILPADVASFRVGCKTQTQLERNGV